VTEEVEEPGTDEEDTFQPLLHGVAQVLEWDAARFSEPPKAIGKALVRRFILRRAPSPDDWQLLSLVRYYNPGQAAGKYNFEAQFLLGEDAGAKVDILLASVGDCGYSVQLQNISDWVLLEPAEE